MNFDISRLRRSDQLIGGGAILFFIFLFLFKWYGVSASAGGVAGISVSASRNGWGVFSNSRWIWLITILVALAAVAISAGLLKFESPVKPGVVVAGLGALSTILILYRIIHHPSASIPGFHAGIKIGIWLGLIASAIVTYGGYLAMGDEGTSISEVRQQASDAMSNLSANAGGSGSGSSSPSTATTSAPPVPPPSAPPAPPAAEPPAGE